MRVLGIDCGTECTGWGVIDSDGRSHRVLALGVIRTSVKKPLDQRLATIAQGLRAVLESHRPDAAAVEEVFYSQNVKTALKLAHVRGVALLAIAEAQITLGEYSPLAIKVSVVGYGRAEKQQVQLMVRTLTGFQGAIETEDASDALAVAICQRDHNITRGLKGSFMTRLLWLAAAVAGLAFAADAPRVSYTKSFPGSDPAYMAITIDKDGATTYREAKDEDPETFKLEPDMVQAIFGLADKLDHFKRPLESGLKVAKTGDKTFRWENGADSSEAKFNYSQDQNANLLQDWFERISESERAMMNLRRAIRFDKLGVNDAVLRVDTAWSQKRLVGREQFLPLLDRIAKNQTFVNIARDRAARLADALRAAGGAKVTVE